MSGWSLVGRGVDMWFVNSAWAAGALMRGWLTWGDDRYLDAAADHRPQVVRHLDGMAARGGVDGRQRRVGLPLAHPVVHLLEDPEDDLGRLAGDGLGRQHRDRRGHDVPGERDVTVLRNRAPPEHGRGQHADHHRDHDDATIHGGHHTECRLHALKRPAKPMNASDSSPAMANHTRWGGSGYYFQDIGTFPGQHGLSYQVALHEFGHSFGNLADEYVEYYGSTYPYGEPWEANVSKYNAAEQAAQLKKWYRWLDHPDVDTFEGARYYQYGIYRSSLSSKMRSSSQHLVI